MRRSSMTVIESEVATSNCFLDLQSLQSLQSLQHTPVYLSVAAFNGYLARARRRSPRFWRRWRSNQDEGIQWDSAVAITGSFI